MKRPPPETFGRTPPGLFVCEGRCGRELPQSADFFDRDSGRQSGFKGVCKECRAADRQMAKLDEMSDKLGKLDDLLSTTLEHADVGGTNVPHIAQIYEEAMGLFGGVKGFALHLLGTYIAAKPGGQTRERILSNLMKIGQAISDEGKLSMPVELMSDDDLNAELAKEGIRLKVRSGDVIDVEEPSARAG